jgi:hypothetical protein
MKKSRASVFENAPDVDISEFAPKPRVDKEAPTPAQVKVVAEAANFPSRQAAAPVSAKPANKHPNRIYRTGRNVQFNAKVSQETWNAIYAVTDANSSWVLGYTLERAIAALQRELKLEKAT